MAAAKSRGTYERERVRMTAATVERAARMIQEGTLAGRGAEIADADTPGLTLRITRSAGTWYLRHRKGTFRLGSMDHLTLSAARLAADRARRDVEAGVSPRDDLGVFEAVLAKGRPVELAVDAAFAETVEVQSDEDRRRRGPWQWRDLIAEFLAAKLPTLKESYRPLYAAYHAGHEFEAIEQRDLAAIDIADLEDLRDRVAESRTVSAAARVVAQNKEALSWAWKYHGTRAGLSDEKYPWWQERWDIEYANGTREHTPTVDELVRTILLVEQHRRLGGTDQETSTGTVAAMWAVVLTAQRTGALTQLRQDRIISWQGHPGWQVWTWPGEVMKGGKNGGRPHAIPIPPAAVEVLSRYAPSTDSEWAFPSRATGKHVTPVGLNQLMYRLAGKPKAGKKGAVTNREKDLLSAHRIRPWGPHDARRSLSSYLADEELGGAGSAILAHSRGKGEEEEARVEDITRKVYVKSQRLPLKSKGMAAWVDHVLAAYERERVRFKPLPLS